MEQLYAAHRLSRDQEEIRLFHIHPGTWDADIEGEFSVVSLKNDSEFVALSYTWGNVIDAPPTTVKVQGQPIPVSPNLHEALRRLRWHALQYEEVVIWADALCINQADMQEKQHQIPLMRKIYSECQHTDVWLGELSHINLLPDPESRDPIEAVKNVIAKLKTDAHLTSISLFDRDETDTHFTNVQKIFDSVSRSPWFTRRWVVQEAILAPVVKVLFGPVSMDLEYLCMAMDMYADHIEINCCTTSELGHYQLRGSIRAFLQEFTSLRYYRDRYRGGKAHILDLCMDFASRETSLGHDYVYSLLGLTRPPSDIIPDYTIPLPVLFADICRDYVDQTRCLDFLPFAGNGDPQSEIPSWAIDWTGPDSTWKWLTRLFNPVGQLSQFPKCTSLYLQILGYPIDKIEGIAEFPTGPSTANIVRLFAADVLGNERLGAEYPTGGTWLEAWLRTLSADSCWGANSARRFTSKDIAFYLAALSGSADNIGPTVQLAGGREVLAYAHMNDIFRMVDLVQDGRVLFYTYQGYIGVADDVIGTGDTIYLVRSLHLFSDTIILKHDHYTES